VYFFLGQPEFLIDAENWPKLSAIGCIESQRRIANTATTKLRYYLLSLPPDVKRFADSARGHWSIESQRYWILDLGFREDQARASLGHSAENLAVTRHLAVSL
jgi:predicted transposase YbfD/YdcC